MQRELKFVVLMLLMAAHFSLSAASRDALWRQVDEAVQKGLPKTAITNLEPIIAGALKDKAYAEATKAIAKKIGPSVSLFKLIDSTAVSGRLRV
jgi:hypothetical protein